MNEEMRINLPSTGDAAHCKREMITTKRRHRLTATVGRIFFDDYPHP